MGIREKEIRITNLKEKLEAVAVNVGEQITWYKKAGRSASDVLSRRDTS